MDIAFLNIHIDLKEKGLHGWVDEGVSKEAKAVESKGEHNHIVVPGHSVEEPKDDDIQKIKK